MPAANPYLEEVVGRIKGFADHAIRTSYFELVRQSLVWGASEDSDELANVVLAKDLIAQTGYGAKSLLKMGVLLSYQEAWRFLNQAGESITLSTLRREFNKRDYKARFGDDMASIGNTRVFTYKELLHFLNIDPPISYPPELA